MAFGVSVPRGRPMPEGDVLHSHALRLERVFAGRRLTECESRRVRLSELTGHEVRAVRAEGKNLLIEFDDGRVLRTHLRMHGRIRVVPRAHPAAAWRGPSVVWLLSTEQATALCLDAPTVELLRPSELRAHPVLAALGPDVLAPELALAEIVARLRADPERELGSALLDQTLLSGIGNIYKSESLFLARLSPFAPVRAFPDAELERVVKKARELMRRNVGGGRRTTPRGRIGPAYWVYERAGEACLRCDAPIRMQRQEPLSRSTYYCPGCQPAPEPPP